MVILKILTKNQKSNKIKFWEINLLICFWTYMHPDNQISCNLCIVWWSSKIVNFELLKFKLTLSLVENISNLIILYWHKTWKTHIVILDFKFKLLSLKIVIIENCHVIMSPKKILTIKRMILLYIFLLYFFLLWINYTLHRSFYLRKLLLRIK